MMIEPDSQQSESALDVDLFDAFKTIAFEEYEYLRPDRAQFRSRKTPFLRGTTREPDLTYGRIESVDVHEVKHVLDELTSRLEGADRIVQRVYAASIEEMRLRVSLLEAARRMDDATFAGVTETLYGVPDRALFYETLDGVAQIIHTAKTLTSDPEILGLFARFDPVFASAPSDWRRITTERIAPDRERTRKQDKRASSLYSSAEIKARFEAELERLGINTWEVQIDEPGARVSFNTNQALKTILIPHDRDLFSRKKGVTLTRIDALIAHEIRAHVVRRELGEASKLSLLGLGLDRYLRGEEGVATYLEQQIKGVDGIAGEMGYLAVSLALGLDGVPRTFRTLHDLLYPYILARMMVDARERGVETSTQYMRMRATSFAYARCIRTFRGTTGKTPGVAFTRDIVYREGNVRIHELVRTNPEWVEHFSIGKFDPTNEAHVELLISLDLLPAHMATAPAHAVSSPVSLTGARAHVRTGRN